MQTNKQNHKLINKLNKYITKLLAVFAVLINLSFGEMTTLAQTNVNATLTESVSTGGRANGGWEFTLGADGTRVNSKETFGLDFSVSTTPLPETFSWLWVGVAQGVYWEPTFAGSTDVYVDWSRDVWNDTVWINIGWSVGAVYDRNSTQWRTGPEFVVQYYTSDNAIIFAGVNYDFVDKGDDGFRYGFGIGLFF